MKYEYKGLLKFFKSVFGERLRNKDNKTTEVLIMLILGHQLGIGVVSRISDYLNIDKNEVYKVLREMSIKDWRDLFYEVFRQELEDLIIERQTKSASTSSRDHIQLSIDDSTIRKWGSSLSYLGKWWSGQFHRVLKGYNVLLIVVKVGHEICPLDFHLMSKKGPLNNKHRRLEKMLSQISKRWLSKGINISKISVSADAAYADNVLIKHILSCGFTKVLVGAKPNYVLRKKATDKKGKSIRELIKVTDFEDVTIGWGMNEPVIRRSGWSPTFGKVVVAGRKMFGKVSRVFAFGVHRSAEIFKIWKAHYLIETIFRKLKHFLTWGKSQLRGSNGAYATIVTPFLALAFTNKLKKRLNVTFDKAINTIRFWALKDGQQLIDTLELEHFHPIFASIDTFLTN